MAKSNNLAYDYSIYEQEVRQPKQRIQVKKNHAVKTYSATKSLVTAIAALCLLCAILYGKVEMNKVFSQTTAANNQLTHLQGENVRLQTEIESKSSLKNVESYAENQLKLQKLDKAQIEYVELQKENVIHVVKEKDKNVFVKIKSWFNDTLEYIGA